VGRTSPILPLKGASRTRSWTVESHISNIAEDIETERPLYAGPNDLMIRVRSPEFMSLPSTLASHWPTAQLHRCRETPGSDRLEGKPSNNPKHLCGHSGESTDSRMIRTSQSISCLSDNQQQSPILMFLPKILRTSFSKLMTIPHRSKSPGSSKNSVENDSSSLSLSECHRNHSSSSLVSPITEEIVSESMEKGLPIIPFAHPTFHISSNVPEEEKITARKNSLKNLKLAFCENKRKNRSIFQEEDEILDTQHHIQRKSSILAGDDDDETKKSQKSEDQDSKVSNSSPYVEMSPGYSRSIALNSELDRFGEEPYMCMNEFLSGSKKSKSEISRKFSDEQIFHLEEGSPRQTDMPVYHPKSHDYTPMKGRNMFSIGDGTMSVERGLSRLRKKGNKHKADYVFVDFEKNNYVDMQQMGTKKWKFLTFHSTGKKKEK